MTMVVSELPKTTPKELIARYIRKKCKKFQPNINFFLNPNDAISELPLRGIEHDQDVVEAIKFLSQFLPDNFIDVGANIGLISLAVSGSFRRTICLEPNPLVFNILKTNAMLNIENYELFEVGLAAETKTIELHVPKVNLGGAFILEGNEYTKMELAQKDGYKEFNPANYLVQAIEVVTCEDFFGKFNLTSGQSVVIKIDVEGLDQFLFTEMLRLFKNHFVEKKIALVFESHTSESARKINSLVEKFEYQVFNILVAKKQKARNPIVRRMLKLLKGESAELIFSDDLERQNSQFTNYVCMPKRLAY